MDKTKTEGKLTTEQELVDALLEDDAFRAEYNRHLLYALIHGRQGYGKNMRAKQKLMADISSLDNVRRPATLDARRLAEPKLPQKVCNYRKPKVYWFGELHSSNNFIYNPGWSSNTKWWAPVSRHWEVENLFLKGRDPKDGLSVFPVKPMGSSTGRYEGAYPIKGVDDGIRGTAQTVSHKTNPWKPQAELYIMSGKPLKINEKEKETIERVKRIEFPEA